TPVPVRPVDDRLGSGVGVHGRHHGLPESDAPADDLDDRRDAVCRAARAGDDAGRTAGQVRPMDEGLHLAAVRRRRQEDKPRSGPDVFLELVAPREHPGALEHQVDAQLLPGEPRWVAAPQRAQLAAGDDQIAAVDEHGLRVAPVHRVEAEQIGEIVDLDQIVDGDQLEGRLVDHQLQDRASDSSQAIDGDSGAHAASSVSFSIRAANRLGTPSRHDGADLRTAPSRGRPDAHYFSRVILPHAIGSVTCAGMGPSEATDAGSLPPSGMPWMKTTRRSRSSFWPSNAFANAACRAGKETVSWY